MAHQAIPSVIEDISAMYRTNYMGFASFSMLIWDHVDTFQTEVEYIWQGRKGILVYLFLINRYLTPLGFIVNLYGSTLAVTVSVNKCSRFIRFEGSMTVIGINIVAVMMFLRVYALYKGQNVVLGVVIFLFLFQVCMNGWLLTRGEAVVHNELSGVLGKVTSQIFSVSTHLIFVLEACTMIFDPEISVLASSSAWLPLLYDTVVLALIAYRTLPSLRLKNRYSIMKRLLEDGLIYYTAIFAVTAVLTIMIIAAPPGLKNITAQLELLVATDFTKFDFSIVSLTVAMMSRITLNLKKSVGRVNDVQAELPSMFTQGSLHVNPDLKVSTPGFTSQRGRSNSKSIGGDFAMKSVPPTSQGKENWEEEESDWDDSGRVTVSSRINELRTIGGTLRFADSHKGRR
ncbi:hypothetical protein M413DRAFT_9782 [Hebeloma cylindrosporum]|uniref:DUF6533 domain-containing protein n=1 Tax=Hebeloma cylindrosporum TaxID=76867 RepID=A0A0C3CFK7_HEBCY|nr:hypothetical protein M413DRAFT_9782 [Hebeloma cylindrosporum h7]